MLLRLIQKLHKAFVLIKKDQLVKIFIALAGVGLFFDFEEACASDYNNNAGYFLTSEATNQLMLFDENTGKFKKIVYSVPKLGASEICFGGDLFIPSVETGNIYRFDGYSGDFKGIFVHKGDGGLVMPSMPKVGPDNLMYVGDLATNKILRYDESGAFVDVFTDNQDSGLDKPKMSVFDSTSFYVVSAGTNSVLRWDIKTKKFLGAFISPGSGGLDNPIGLEIGPDGNFYVSSNGSNSILRYNGKTGEFMNVFVSLGGTDKTNSWGIRFGGLNSNLYVASRNANKVMEFDRVTGDLVRVVSDGDSSGLSNARGLTFSSRPNFHISAQIIGCGYFHGAYQVKHVFIDHEIKDFSDDSPKIKFISITSSDKNVDISKAVSRVSNGNADYLFDLDFTNKTGVDQHYTLTYSATNSHGLSTIATAEVRVPPH
jgi:hypothetical protein